MQLRADDGGNYKAMAVGVPEVVAALCVIYHILAVEVAGESLSTVQLASICVLSSAAAVAAGNSNEQESRRAKSSGAEKFYLRPSLKT